MDRCQAQWFNNVPGGRSLPKGHGIMVSRASSQIFEMHRAVNCNFFPDESATSDTGATLCCTRCLHPDAVYSFHGHRIRQTLQVELISYVLAYQGSLRSAVKLAIHNPFLPVLIKRHCADGQKPDLVYACGGQVDSDRRRFPFHPRRRFIFLFKSLTFCG
ncbi:hypothetical protein T08_4643 [Trichinella sp. T8]|nr:hypothetical protein T08_4643 [Trichinella sp. T8]